MTQRSRNVGKTLLPDDFEVTEKMKVWALQKVPEVDIEAQTERFMDYYLGHGKRMANWQAAWRTWMRNAYHWGNHAKPRFLDAR